MLILIYLYFISHVITNMLQRETVSGGLVMKAFCAHSYTYTYMLEHIIVICLSYDYEVRIWISQAHTRNYFAFILTNHLKLIRLIFINLSKWTRDMTYLSVKQFSFQENQKEHLFIFINILTGSCHLLNVIHHLCFVSFPFVLVQNAITDAYHTYYSSTLSFFFYVTELILLEMCLCVYRNIKV